MSNIFKYFNTSAIKKLVRTSTFRQSGVTFVGTIINGLLGAVFYIIAARNLGPESFGLLSVAIAVLTLTGDIGDLGTDTGLVRFVGKYIKSDIKKAKRFLKLGLEIKLAVSLLVIIIGIVSAPFFSQIVFTKPELLNPLRIISFGVGTYLLFTFATHSLQAIQKFFVWSVVQISTNFVRLMLIFLLIYLMKLSIENTLFIYIAMPLLGFLITLPILPKRFLKIKNEFSVAKDFFHYNKWIAAFTLVAAIGARLDTFISARLLSSYDVGIYSAANQLAQIVPQIVAAVGTVIAPKMSSMDTMKKFISYLKKTQVMISGLVLAGVATIPVSIFLIPIIYGPEYRGSVSVFIVLFIAMLVFLFSVPIHMSVFYYFAYPKLFFYTSLGHMLIIFVFGWILTSTYGAMGSATTVLIGQIFNFIVPFVWVLNKLKSRK